MSPGPNDELLVVANNEIRLNPQGENNVRPVMIMIS